MNYYPNLTFKKYRTFFNNLNRFQLLFNFKSLKINYIILYNNIFIFMGNLLYYFVTYC